MSIHAVTIRLEENLLEEPLRKIAECGDCEEQLFSPGTRVILLPPRTVEIAHLNPAKWGQGSNNGPTRLVQEIRSVAGERLHDTFWTKQAETRLTLSKAALGDVWWDKARGPDGNNFFAVDGDVLRAFTRWEAAYLTKLWKEGLPAEEPQAIVEYPDGGTELVTKNLNVPTWRTHWTAADMATVPDTCKELRERATALGFEPVDFQSLADMTHRRQTIIDVARWSWSPYTDALFQEVRTQLQAALNAAKDAGEHPAERI